MGYSFKGIKSYLKGGGMKRRDFTLIELVIVVVVVLILSTFAAGGYRQLIDNSRSRVDQANLRVLNAAVEAYALENDSFPATLGQLRLKDLRRGYVKVIKTASWRTKLSYFLIYINVPAKAYAAHFLSMDTLGKYGTVKEIFHDPADTNGPPSYGINIELKDKRWNDIEAGTLIIGDCDNWTFKSASGLAERHSKHLGFTHFANVITKEGKIGEISGSEEHGKSKGCGKPKKHKKPKGHEKPEEHGKFLKSMGSPKDMGSPKNTEEH